MLALLGLATILVLLIAIMSNRMSPLVALIAVPVIAALIGGFGLGTGKLIVDGIKAISPVAGMFVFAILFFGVMSDAGMMDPIIDGILGVVGTRPSRITLGSTLLALLIHLDGSGAVCFLITIPAMLPLYDRLGMDKRILACCASMAAGVNFLPWTGPMIRSAAALKVPSPYLHPADPRPGLRSGLHLHRRLPARPARGAATGLVGRWPGGARLDARHLRKTRSGIADRTCSGSTSR